MNIFDLHRRVVHQDSDSQRQSAQRHDVDRLAHCRPSTISDVRMESGIDTQTISVLRQLPRNSRIISAVRAAAIVASRNTPLTAARTNTD